MLNIYKASAGSGKTYTLVKEYLRIAFKDTTAYRHILAITFTNKAAGEMKERVIDALHGIANSNPAYDNLADELSGTAGINIPQLRKNAALILRSMLHNYSDIGISTIDSFVHRIVRSFAYDLRIPMSFDIEMDSKKLLNEAVALLLDRLSEADTQVTKAVIEFAESLIEEGRNWNVEYSLASLGSELFVDEARPYIEKLGQVTFEQLKDARAALYARKNAIEQRLFSEGRAAYNSIVTANHSATDFHYGTKGLFGFFEKYANGELPNHILGNTYVLATVNNDNWGKKSPVPEHLRQQLKQHYRNIETIWQTDGPDYYFCHCLLKNFFSFILLVDLQKMMDEIKKDNNILYIGDFHQKVFEIVKHQDAPVIYERIGEWYNNILIDEFQDTSVLQWRNLLPLIENTQFKSEDSLIVGDGKQAIYRFRGGEVEQFTALPAVYGSHEDELLMQRETAIHNYGTKVVELQYNYRSRKEVIDFNNAFYEQMLTVPELRNKAVYADYHQLQGKSAEGGFVQIEFLAADEESGDDIHTVRANRVEELVNDVLMRGYRLKDIAVLTRSNKNASVVASHLISKGIKVVSPESLLIQHSPRVRLLLSLLTYLDRKDNLIARTEILHFTHLLHQQNIRYEAIKLDGTIDEYEEVLRTATGIPFYSARLPTGRLSDLMLYLVRLFNLSDADPFVQFFMDEVLLYAGRYGNNIADFLFWWEGVKFKKSIIYPESLDAVRVMTIHKAKGLQFPLVILADASVKKQRGKDFFWVPVEKDWLPGLNMAILPVDKELEKTDYAAVYSKEDELSFMDMLNLLYVATTRPEEALYILSEEAAKEPEENNSMTALLVTFLRNTQRWDGFKTYHFGDEAYSALQKKDKEADNLYNRMETPPGELLVSTLQVKMNPERLWSDEARNKVDEGKLFHEVLKQVTYAGQEEKAVNRFCALGLIAEYHRQEWVEKVKEVTGNPALQAYFAKDALVLNERTLLKKGSFTRRPDRVVITGNQAVVIDFKTGKQDDDNRRQVNGYAAWLTEAGLQVSRKLLFYTTEQLLEEVP